jgi:hypothetical protein
VFPDVPKHHGPRTPRPPDASFENMNAGKDVAALRKGSWGRETLADAGMDTELRPRVQWPGADVDVEARAKVDASLGVPEGHEPETPRAPYVSFQDVDAGKDVAAPRKGSRGRGTRADARRDSAAPSKRSRSRGTRAPKNEGEGESASPDKQTSTD